MVLKKICIESVISQEAFSWFPLGFRNICSQTFFILSLNWLGLVFYCVLYKCKTTTYKDILSGPLGFTIYGPWAISLCMHMWMLVHLLVPSTTKGSTTCTKWKLVCLTVAPFPHLARALSLETMLWTWWTWAKSCTFVVYQYIVGFQQIFMAIK